MATKSKGTAVAKWDEELARRAQIAKGMEDSVSLGQFLSFRGAQMSYNGNQIEGNKMQVVVLSSVLENKYYDAKFDPDSPASPVCYAFGTLDKDMKPHEKAPSKQAEKCAGCEHNEWGSSSRGRGKACKNVRRVALLHRDSLKTDEDVANGTVIYAEIPVTSVKAYASFVQGVAAVKKAPPFAVIAEISVATDPKTQLKVSFKVVGDVPRERLGAVLQRADAIDKQIGFAYPMFDEEEGGKKASSKKSAKSAKKTTSRF